jgi:NitT/TauT family transport system substrate-binding protein
MKNRTIARGLGACVLALALAAGFGQRNAAAADKVILGKAVPFAWTFIPADVGLEQGIWARYGIDLEIIGLAGSAKVQQALASKSITFALAGGTDMAFAVKGSPVIAVAAFGLDPRNLAVVVAQDSSIRSVADLRGKSIGVTTVGSLTEWLARRMAYEEGWGANGVVPVALGGMEASVAALKTKQVDALVIATEIGLMLEDKHEGRIVVNMARYAPDFHTHVIFARKDLVADDPGLVDRFVKGWFASVAFVKTHKAETTAVAMRVLGQSKAVMDKTYDDEVSMLSDDGRFDAKAVAVIKQSFVDMDILQKLPDDSELFTTRFVPAKP